MGLRGLIHNQNTDLDESGGLPHHNNFDNFAIPKSNSREIE